jgi:hypothetical protein
LLAAPETPHLFFILTPFLHPCGDHIRLAMGCPLAAAPAEVALGFLHNLAYLYGMKAVFQFGAYVGTFGEYHQGAVKGERPARDDEV